MKLYKVIESISNTFLSKVIGLDDLPVFQKQLNCTLFTTENSITENNQNNLSQSNILLTKKNNNDKNINDKKSLKLSIDNDILLEENESQFTDKNFDASIIKEKEDKESKLSSPRWPDKSDLSNISHNNEIEEILGTNKQDLSIPIDIENEKDNSLLDNKAELDNQVEIENNNNSLSANKLDLSYHSEEDNKSNNSSLSHNSSVNLNLDNNVQETDKEKKEEPKTIVLPIKINFDNDDMNIENDAKTTNLPLHNIDFSDNSQDSVINDCKSVNVNKKRKIRIIKKKKEKSSSKPKTLYNKTNNNSTVNDISDMNFAKSANASVISTNRTFKRKKLNISNIFA